MTYLKALEELKNGNVDEAWRIARMDGGLVVDCTKAQWVAYALKASAKSLTATPCLAA